MICDWITSDSTATPTYDAFTIQGAQPKSSLSGMTPSDITNSSSQTLIFQCSVETIRRFHRSWPHPAAPSLRFREIRSCNDPCQSMLRIANGYSTRLPMTRPLDECWSICGTSSLVEILFTVPTRKLVGVSSLDDADRALLLQQKH